MSQSGNFDYILLETTGLADPGNIAPIFWLDNGLGSSIYLDGIVTLVDAANIIKCLEDKTPLLQKEREEEERKKREGPRPEMVTGMEPRERPEEGLTTAHLQISQADVVVVNKADLVGGEEVEKVVGRVRGINGVAKVVVTEHGRVEGGLEGWLLDIRAYETFEGLKTEVKSVLDPVGAFENLSRIPLIISRQYPLLRSNSQL